MINLDLSTPAILFPAISLFMLAYTNRFSKILDRIRELNEKYEGQCSDHILKQINMLEKRVKLIILMQALMIASTFFCVISICLLLFSYQVIGKMVFLVSILLMVSSLMLSFMEVTISGKAIGIQLSGMKQGMKV